MGLMMQHKYLKNLGIAFLLSCSYAKVSWAEPAKPLSLKNVLDQYLKSQQVREAETKLDILSEKEITSQSRTFSAPELEVEYGNLGVNDAKPVASAYLNQTLNFGNSKSRVREKVKADAELKRAQLDSTIRDRLTSISNLYTELKFYQRLYQETKKVSDSLTPLLAQATAAADQGQTSSLALLKTQVLEQHIKTELLVAKSSFQRGSQQLLLAGNLRSQLDIDTSVLQEISKPDLRFNPNQDPDLRQLLSESQSLGHAAKLQSSAWNFTAGAGVEQDYNTDERAYMVRLEFPIGSSLINRAASNATLGHRDYLDQHFLLLRSAKERDFTALVSSLQTKELEEQARKHEVKNLSAIYTALQRASKSGLSSFEELIEALGRLHESTKSLIELQKELDSLKSQLIIAGGFSR